jgi:hypothetical protein
MKNNDYKIWACNDGTLSHWGVHFVDGEFKGTIVEVLNFGSKDFNDGDTLCDLLEISEGEINLIVEYGVLHKPDDISLDLLMSEEFGKYFSVIIGDIVKETAENYDKIRDDNFKEFNSQ